MDQNTEILAKLAKLERLLRREQKLALRHAHPFTDANGWHGQMHWGGHPFMDANMRQDWISERRQAFMEASRWHDRMPQEGRPFMDASRGQGRILAMLKMKDGISTKELSYLLGIRVSSLNETLAKLEKNGYIKRSPSPDDKRVSIIHLTEKGRQEDFAQAEAPDIFVGFSEEEKQTFCGYLDRLIAELESRGRAENPKANDEVDEIIEESEDEGEPIEG